MTPEVYGILALVFIFVLSLFVLFSSGSVMAVLVLWLLIGLIGFVLIYYGFVDINKMFDYLAPPKPVADTTPTPTPAKSNLVQGSEVFYISDNQFTYDEASAVCAAYGAQLATLEQVIDVYNHGAEWCGYGWSAGGMALYPTQKSTWEELQREIDPGKRTACGRPGVNGGYFDPSTKFGVNCFGFKPKGDFKPPAPVPGTDLNKFRSMVNRFKEMIKSLNLSPYSRQEWSGYDSSAVNKAANYGAQFSQNLGGLEHFTERMGMGTADPSVVEAPTTTSAYTAGPYGLRGDRGEIGPAGPIGKSGPRGDKGELGGLGPAGPLGPQGQQGIQGVKGDKGDTGPAGIQGPIGPGGSGAGVAGPKGDTGPAGAIGQMGPQGIPGIKGDTGPVGPRGPKGDKGDKGDPAEPAAYQDSKAADRAMATQSSQQSSQQSQTSAPLTGRAAQVESLNKQIADLTVDIANDKERWKEKDDDAAFTRMRSNEEILKKLQSDLTAIQN
jgi:hypothetical protein